jgi:hypothetical protein
MQLAVNAIGLVPIICLCWTGEELDAIDSLALLWRKRMRAASLRLHTLHLCLASAQWPDQRY